MRVLCDGAVATFGTQLGNNLSASEMNGLLNGSATQSQLDMFASRAGELSNLRCTVLSVCNIADGLHARLCLSVGFSVHAHSWLNMRPSLLICQYMLYQGLWGTYPHGCVAQRTHQEYPQYQNLKHSCKISMRLQQQRA